MKKWHNKKESMWDMVSVWVNSHIIIIIIIIIIES